MGNSLSCPNGCSQPRHLLKRCTCNITAPYHLLDSNETATLKELGKEDQRLNKENGGRVTFLAVLGPRKTAMEFSGSISVDISGGERLAWPVAQLDVFGEFSLQNFSIAQHMFRRSCGNLVRTVKYDLSKPRFQSCRGPSQGFTTTVRMHSPRSNHSRLYHRGGKSHLGEP